MSTNLGRRWHPLGVLLMAVMGGLVLLPAWVGTWIGIDPRVALPVIAATVIPLFCVGMRPTLIGVLLLIVLGGVVFVLARASIWLGIDPQVALPVAFSTALVLFYVLVLLPVRVSDESSVVFPGPAEPLFRIATDIRLSLEVSPDGRRLLSQSGEPGQPGSSFVTKEGHLTLTTTVVRSDPPTKLVTTITGGGIHIDRERTFLPVPEGTRIEIRDRKRMPLLAWLVRPVSTARAKVQVTRKHAQLTDYLAVVAAHDAPAGDSDHHGPERGLERP